MMQPPYAYPAAYPQPYARQPQRNVALIVIGAILLAVALFAGFVFLMNFYQYATIEDRWANERFLDPAARQWGIELIKNAAMKRMMMFGPISGLFGIGGVVLGILGLRKK